MGLSQLRQIKKKNQKQEKEQITKMSIKKKIPFFF